MRLDDGTILMHEGAPYDPAKAHAYYLRTRQLKGRKKGSPSFSVKTADGTTVNLSSRQLTEQRVYAAKRVNDIKKKLDELNTKLREAVQKAKQKKAKAEIKADKPKTAAEKSEDARESKKFRDKHKQKLANKRKVAAKNEKKLEDDDPVAQLETKIGEIKKRLSTAVAIQRALVGATRNN